MPAAREHRSSHFKTLQQFQLEYAPVTVTQYESSRTGMRCVVVDQKGPKVNGYFAIPRGWCVVKASENVIKTEVF